LDPVDAEPLIGAFAEVPLQREGVWKDSRFRGGYWVSLAGTEPSESAKIPWAK
jgi:hypothetical protein